MILIKFFSKYVLTTQNNGNHLNGEFKILIFMNHKLTLIMKAFLESQILRQKRKRHKYSARNISGHENARNDVDQI